MKKYYIFLCSLFYMASINSQEPPKDSIDYKINQNSKIESDNIDLSGLITHNRSRVFEVLRGKVSGLEINSSSGGPGSSTLGVLRGYNSIINNNSPLIILDGMIIDNSEFNTSLGGVDQTNRLIDINANDIRMVNVLKGSVGAAKYGIRGSNGVLELTSKSVNNKNLTIGFSSSLAISQANKLIPLQNQYAQGRSNIYRGPETGEGSSWGPLISELEYDGDESYLFDNKGRLVPLGSGNGEASQAYDPYNFLQSAISQDYNLTLGKGSEIYNYRISAGINKTKGIIPNTFYDRYSIAANLMVKPISKLTINSGLRYISSVSYKNIKGSSLNGIMLGLTRTSPSFDNANGLTSNEALSNESAYILADGSQRSYRNGIYDNPYWSINKNPNNNNTNRVIGNINASYTLNENYDFSIFSGIDQYNENQNGGIASQEFNGNGSAYDNTRSFFSFYNKANLAGKYNLSEKLIINGNLGFDFYLDKTTDELVSGTGIAQGMIANISNTSSSSFANNYSKKATYGTFLSTNVEWNKLIDFQIVARYDKSSALGKNNDGMLSYGLSADIDLLKLGTPNNEYSDLNDNLFLSFGIGRTGNDIPGSINRRTLQPLQISGDGFISQTTINNLMEISNFAVNNDLGAEITDAVELGFRSINLNKRLSFNVKMFCEKTKDVISTVNIDNSSGFDFMLFNDYTISNQGFEVDVWSKIISTQKIEWTLSANLSKNNSKVINSKSQEPNVRLNGFSSVNTSIIVDQPYGVITGSSFVRDNANNLVIGADGFPIINSLSDVIGNPIPEFLLNITNDIKINNKLTISGLIDIRSGGDIWCGTCGVLDYFGRTEIAAEERDQTIIFEGVNSMGMPNDIPVNLTSDNTNENYRVRYGFSGISEMNIYNVSWIRLREVSVSYQINTQSMNFIRDLSFSVFAHNLFLITDYPGIDPETNVSGSSNGRGIDYFNNPNTKSFGVTVNATF